MSALAGFHHVKLPVTDVERSRAWYQRTFDLSPQIDFVEHGVLMGVALSGAGDRVHLALRQDAIRARALAGFDPVALAVPTRADLERWRDRFDRLREPHGGIVAGHLGWTIVGLYDPDGIEVRLYTVENHDGKATQ
jgi:catechol 2,3-dioxygenase-like lactoylglutathione lyase family enzyme